jgi:hypothetical protein
MMLLQGNCLVSEPMICGKVAVLCIYASYLTDNKGLLTEQALLLSKESLLRQQTSGPSCANALVLCLLLHRENWILQVKAG